jgi:ribosome-associated translation inhibitor RaiA
MAKGRQETSMLVHIRTDNHISGREELVGEIESRVEESLRRFSPQLTRVEVHLSDENAQKSGDDDKKCTLEARLAGLQPVAVSDTGDTLDQAVNGALDKLTVLLDRKLGRLREKKGRTSAGGEDQA